MPFRGRLAHNAKTPGVAGSSAASGRLPRYTTAPRSALFQCTCRRPQSTGNGSKAGVVGEEGARDARIDRTADPALSEVEIRRVGRHGDDQRDLDLKDGMRPFRDRRRTKTSAQLTPTCAAVRVWVPLPEKLPETVLAEHGSPPRPGALYWRVAATGRSVTPSLFNTVSGSENLATIRPSPELRVCPRRIVVEQIRAHRERSARYSRREAARLPPRKGKCPRRG